MFRILCIYSYDYLFYSVIYLFNIKHWVSIQSPSRVIYEIALTFLLSFNNDPFFLRGSRFGFHTIINIQNGLQTQICAEEMQL